MDRMDRCPGRKKPITCGPAANHGFNEVQADHAGL
jgi:hypothetical protein